MVPNTFTYEEIATSRFFIINKIHKDSMFTSGALRGNPYTTYQALVSNIGYSIEDEYDGLHSGNLAGGLNELEADATGLLLSAVVVNQGDMRPGRGFFTLAQELGALPISGTVDPDGIDELTFWKEQVERIVRAYGKQVGRLIL
jgi:hypothetical protein